MVNGYFPSVRHLLAGQDRSVFGSRTGAVPEGVAVLWGYSAIRGERDPRQKGRALLEIVRRSKARVWPR